MGCRDTGFWSGAMRKKGPLGIPRRGWEDDIKVDPNSLNAKLNPICHLLALFGTHCILHVSRVRVKEVEWSAWTGSGSG